MDDSDRGGSPCEKAKDPRQERLKRALRDNLKRRKSQVRERGGFTSLSSASDQVPHGDGEHKPG